MQLNISSTVIVAERDPWGRRLLLEALMLRGFSVTAASTGDALLELISQHHSSGDCCAAVLTSLSRQPAQNALRLARSYWPNVLFVIVTGTSALEADPWIDEENLPVLLKPINIDRLTSMIRAAGSGT